MAAALLFFGKRMNRGKYGQLPLIMLSIWIEQPELVWLEIEGLRALFLCPPRPLFPAPMSPRELMD